MAYNRRNLLNRVIKVQDVTLEHTKTGTSQQWVYNNIIFPTFAISIGTYYNYLACNAKAELKKLDQAEETHYSHTK